jgi:indolepyruvate ferredoxin oxidoreductase beta subunit
MIIVGFGGQGTLTLANMVEKCALREGHAVRGCELHGLAQRGGVSQCHIRFGEDIRSPLVREGNADLIIALESLEALRACYYASKGKTTILTDTYRFLPISVYLGAARYPSLGEITKNLKDFGRVGVVEAAKISEKMTGDIVSANIFMAGYAIANRLLPIKKESMIAEMKARFSPDLFELNKKVFEKASQFRLLK